MEQLRETGVERRERGLQFKNSVAEELQVRWPRWRGACGQLTGGRRLAEDTDGEAASVSLFRWLWWSNGEVEERE